MTRNTLACLLLALGACGDESGPAIEIADGALTDATDTGDAALGDSVDATDAVEVDILYPGYLCDEDDRCSTGLCYGTATSQGFFEPPQCQSQCLAPFDFLHYCDSDDDCCRGRCCVDCGAQEGLCVLP